LCYGVAEATWSGRELNDFARAVVKGVIVSFVVFAIGSAVLLIALYCESVVALRLLLGTSGGIIAFFGAGNLLGYTRVDRPQPLPASARQTGGPEEAKHLNNNTLVHEKYQCGKPSWDYDFCEFCGAKFSITEAGCQTAGYSMPGRMRWICESCFDKVNGQYAWTVIERLHGSLKM